MTKVDDRLETADTGEAMASRGRWDELADKANLLSRR